MKLKKFLMMLLFLRPKAAESTSIEKQTPVITDSKHPFAETLPGWLNIGCSVMGKSHISNNIPCQDAHFTGRLSEKWGIAVVSDGAGSHINSHHGATFLVRDVPEVLYDLINSEKWFIEGTFPTPKEWRDIAITALSFVYDDLKTFGFINYMPLNTLGGTINVLMYSDKGFMSAHIGDGRAAVRFEDGTWASVITPFKGEQAGETVFITSDYTWREPSLCIETRVIQKPITGFALLSDGLETYSFYCNLKKENEDIYYDPNKPFDKFFNQNVNAITSMFKEGKNRQEIEEKFSNYLLEGHPSMSQEPDDKTIVLGIKLLTNEA